MDEAAAKSDFGHEMNHGMMMASNDNKPQDSAKTSSQFEYQVSTSPSPPKMGANDITVSIHDMKTKQHKKGLKVKAQVYMMSMDMGTDEPRVREIAPGKYKLKATFAMQGPWAVKLMLPDEEKIFNFDVQSSK